MRCGSVASLSAVLVLGCPGRIVRSTCRCRAHLHALLCLVYVSSLHSCVNQDCASSDRCRDLCR